MTAGSQSGRSLLLGWRLWLGLAVSVVAVYWTLRGVDLGEVWNNVREARLLPILLILPLHPLGLYVRALRWRHLAIALDSEPLAMGPLFRATALGFLGINILPFRVGELVRPWALARETGVRGAAALGTLILERAIDFATLLLIGAGVLLFQTAAVPEWVRVGAGVLAALAVVPFAAALALRVQEARTLRLLALLVRPLPHRLAEPLLGVLTEVCQGLAALEGSRAIAMVLVHSAVLWGVLMPVAFLLGLSAFAVDLDPGQAVRAAYTLLVFTALAVAAPSAPGFFGVYHFACREALALFGVPSAVAVAYGSVLHLAGWIPVTLVGVWVAARSGLSLGEVSARSPE